MTVLYSFPHPLGGPGIGTTAWETVTALGRAGHQVLVSTTSVARPLPADVSGSVRVRTTLQASGRRVPHRALGLRRAYAWHDALTSRLVAHERPSVVHAWPRSCLRTLSAAHRLGVPALRESPSPHSAAAYAVAAQAAATTGATLPPGHFHSGGPRRLAEEEAEYAAATAVLVPSSYAMRTFVDHGHPVARLLRHRYGVDLSRFAPPRQAPPGPLRLVFVGRLEPAKGIDVLLEAWRRSRHDLPDGSRLLLVGTDTAGTAARWPDLAAGAGVEWLGQRPDVPAVLASAHALVLPSMSEGMSLGVLEGMASGLVPLVSDASGVEVRHGVDGLLHRVGDVGTLQEHLRCAADPGTRDGLRENVLAARDDLSWERAAASLVGCYEAAAELGPPG